MNPHVEVAIFLAIVAVAMTLWGAAVEHFFTSRSSDDDTTTS